MKAVPDSEDDDEDHDEGNDGEDDNEDELLTREEGTNVATASLDLNLTQVNCTLLMDRTCSIWHC